MDREFSIVSTGMYSLAENDRTICIFEYIIPLWQKKGIHVECFKLPLVMIRIIQGFTGLMSVNFFCHAHVDIDDFL